MLPWWEVFTQKKTSVGRVWIFSGILETLSCVPHDYKKFLPSCPFPPSFPSFPPLSHTFTGSIFLPCYTFWMPGTGEFRFPLLLISIQSLYLQVMPLLVSASVLFISKILCNLQNKILFLLVPTTYGFLLPALYFPPSAVFSSWVLFFKLVNTNIKNYNEITRNRLRKKRSRYNVTMCANA